MKRPTRHTARLALAGMLGLSLAAGLGQGALSHWFGRRRQRASAAFALLAELQLTVLRAQLERRAASRSGVVMGAVSQLLQGEHQLAALARRSPSLGRELVVLARQLERYRRALTAEHRHEAALHDRLGRLRQALARRREQVHAAIASAGTDRAELSGVLAWLQGTLLVLQADIVAVGELPLFRANLDIALIQLQRSVDQLQQSEPHGPRQPIVDGCALTVGQLRTEGPLLADEAAHARAAGLRCEALERHLTSGLARLRRTARAQRDGHLELLLTMQRLIWAALLLVLGAGLLLLARQVQRTQRELAEQASTDGLTGVANRAWLLTLAEQEVDRATRYDRPLSVLMFDIDHFKNVNDRHGHDIGDQVLIAVCRGAEEALRGSDVLGRMGGEEFAVLLPETDGVAGLEVAERLRRRIARVEVPGRHGATIQTTVSIGVSAWRGADDTAESALIRADHAMLAAKRAGRDQVRSDAQVPVGPSLSTS